MFRTVLIDESQKRRLKTQFVFHYIETHPKRHKLY